MKWALGPGGLGFVKKVSFFQWGESCPAGSKWVAECPGVSVRWIAGAATSGFSRTRRRLASEDSFEQLWVFRVLVQFERFDASDPGGYMIAATGLAGANFNARFDCVVS